MQYSFYLDKPESRKSVVMLNVSLFGKRFRFGTGVSIDPQHWNTERQEPRTADPHRNFNRKRIAAISSSIDEAYNSLQFEKVKGPVNEALIEQFKVRVQSLLSPDTQKESGTSGLQADFKEFADTYTIRSRTGQITSNRPGDVTILLYRRVATCLEMWSSHAKKKLDYSTLDEKFYTDYCKWLSDELQLVDSSISNHVKVLKTFLKWAKQKGYHDSSSFEKFYRGNHRGDTQALSVDELRQLLDLDLTDSPRLSRVRDHFLLQCFTGMRYGDLVRLEPKHFDDAAGIIRYVTQKTDTRCVIPITSPLKRILASFPSRIFEFTSPVKQNVYLKEVAQRAGMDKPTSVAEYRQGKRIETVKPKFELMTTHVARRSYVSASIRFGIPESVISIVTGHSAKGMLQQHYIKLDEEAVRDIVVKGWEQL